MKASDLFVRCLEAEGVTHIFGVPGEENADVMISLMDSSIRFVLCRHEQAAAFAADAYGRLTGKAGVCLGTLGPGATNLVTGVADANMDRAPLVCIIGQGSTRRLHKESHQNMDSVTMFGPITKWAQTIWDAGTVPEVVRKAFKTAEAEKPGATLIELPEDVAKQESDEPPMAAVKTRRPGADHKVVRRAVELIAEAKRPLILAGNGAIRKRAARQLRRFAHKTGIGVVNTFMGKGAVPMSDPHCLFTMGLQSRDYINIALDDADLVISVGYDLVEYAPSFWNHDRSTRIIHIDFEPAEIDSHYPVVLDIQADIADALWQINEALNQRFDDESRLPLFDIGERRKLRDAIHDDLTMEKDDASFPMKPQKILWDVRRASRTGRHPALRRGRPQDVDRPLLPVRDRQHLPHLERVLLDGVRAARGDGREAGPPGPPGARDRGRRRIPDERAGPGDVGPLPAERRHHDLGRRRVRPHQMEAAGPLRRPPLRPGVQQPGLRALG